MKPRKIAILGSRGRLGATCAQEWQERFDLQRLSRAELDLMDPMAIKTFTQQTQADLVINLAGMTQLEACEDAPAGAQQINAVAPELLALGLAARGIPFLHFSTDYVFDGTQPGLYTETDSAHPISVYGKTKREGERAVLTASPQHWVFRVSWLFDGGTRAFPDQILDQARTCDYVEAVSDKISVPTSCRDLAAWLVLLISDLPTQGGLYHACSAGACTWLEYAQAVLDAAGDQPLRCRRVSGIRLAEVPFFRAHRPLNSAMDSRKFFKLIGQSAPDWRTALTKAVRGGTNS